MGFVLGGVSFSSSCFDAGSYPAGFFFVCTLVVVARCSKRSRLSDGLSSASSLIRLYACTYIIYNIHVCIIEPCCCANVGASTCAIAFFIRFVVIRRSTIEVAYVPQHFLMHATSVVCTGVPKTVSFLFWFATRRLIGLYEQSNRSDVFKQSLCDKSELSKKRSVGVSLKGESCTNHRAENVASPKHASIEY